MFKKRRKDAAGLPVSPAAPSRHGHVTSPSPSATTSPRDVSSPGQDFDFDLPSPFFAHDGRPQTSDGIASRQGSVSPKPPVLPDIVRVSSQREGGLLNFGELMGSLGESSARVGETNMKVGNNLHIQAGGRPPANRNVSAPLRPSGPRPEPWSTSKPSPPEALQMEPSLFPLKTPPPPLNTDLPMGRAFVDARDKPYGRPPFRPQLQTTTSSPDLRSQMRPQPADPSNTTSPIAARPADSNARTGPMQSAGPQLERPPSSAPTNYSGTTARSKFSSRSTAAGSDAFVPTIGTPYGDTSSSYPLPQHVATRPKNSGGTSTLGGVDVPTHHSSSSPVVKVEKRKTKLLNPMALLSRRRTGQDEEALAGVRAAQAQALQRQKNVVTRGMDNLPEDFDPRIRGKVVHDFSAPREPRRQFSYNDALDPWGEMQGRNRGLQAPFTLSSPDQRHVSEGSPGRSVHTPMFKEHLSDHGQEDTSAAIQAETLENKAFLNRAGQFSPPGAFPPFVRKNQDIAQGAQGRTSGDLALPGRREVERDSHMSAASSGVSPITQRSSAVVGATDATRQSISSAVSPITNRSSAVAGTATDITGASLSPVSPATSDRFGLPPPRSDSRSASEVSKGSFESGRPKPPSEGSRLGGADDPAVSSGSAVESSDSNTWHVTAISPIVEEQTPKLGNGFTPLPTRPAPVVRQTSDDRSVSDSSNVSSPLPTPDAQTSEDAPRLVQKRADAVGHTKRNVSGAKPKHRVSNASRFSFQFGGESAAEELALEEKARKLGVSPRSGQAASSPAADDLDDDYFDEDAMNDMDEMEFEAQREGDIGGFDDFATPVVPAIQESPTFLMANARKQLQIDDESDGVSEVDSADEAPYWMHDDFRSYTHTREPSAVDGPANVPSTTSPGKLRLNTDLTPGGNALYMHPQAAVGSSNDAQNYAPPQRPDLPHRDSGNSERNRAASGLSFGAGTQSTVSPGPVGHSSSIASGSTEATGLGLSGLGGFKFVDTPDISRPVSLEAQQKLNHYSRKANTDLFPHDATFVDSGVGYAQEHDSDDHYEIDDMYFDDGGFESDMNGQSHPGATVDEADFDNDGFLDPTNRMARYESSNAQNPVRGGFDLPALVGDGPYPSFARPNSAKSREHDSQMLLQDLPLLTTVDPKLIPRRNPSEDAKRLGLSSRAPPLPAMPGLSADGAAKKLQAYHATLADAANKAFAEGRFMRMPSTSTTKSMPEDGAAGATDPTRGLVNEDETGLNGTYPVARSDSKKVPDYTSHRIPPKLSFDFGFGSVDLDDSLLMDDGFDGESDDDIVAAANAEALANDDDGFYGQEFGFYANARPNSSEVEAINGGFFGADGDDGLQRQKSLKEPNLTPITERSEFSTRNSFVGHFSPLTPFTPGGARFSASHWEQNEVTTFDQLRKLKASAFGGSNASLHSDGSGLQINYAGSSAPISARSPITPSGSFAGAPPMAYGYSTDSSGSSNPGSAYPPPSAAFQHHESPHSATMPYVPEMEPTPKRAPGAAEVPTTPGTTTARRFPGKVQSHSRQSSGADSVTYVREQAPDGQGPPRWVLEKRRTSEAGQLEVFSREVLEGWAV